MTGGKEKLYVECFRSVDKLTRNMKLVFDSRYLNELIDYKAEIRIRGSQAVQECYERLLKYIYGINFSYCEFKKITDKQCHDENEDGGNLAEEDVQMLIKQECDKFVEEHRLWNVSILH